MRAGIQQAWLTELGVDTHWMDVRDRLARGTPDAPATSVPPRQDAPAVAPPASSPQPARPIAPTVRLAAQPDDQALRRSRTTNDVVSPQTAPGPEALAVPADMAALAAQVQACEQCARYTGRLRAVPGAGKATRPYYLIVAEQPGLDDEIQGQPFQGDSGRLLQAMLAAVDLPHAQDSYTTYVVKCRAAGGHEPTADEIAACRVHLQHEVALLQPRWILALGRVAAQAVLGRADAFETARGQAATYLLASGADIPVWVTHQPASLLVRSAQKAEAWRDLLGLAQAVRRAEA